MIRTIDEFLAVPGERVYRACEPTCRGDGNFRRPHLATNHGIAAWRRLRFLCAVHVRDFGPGSKNRHVAEGECRDPVFTLKEGFLTPRIAVEIGDRRSLTGCHDFELEQISRSGTGR